MKKIFTSFFLLLFMLTSTQYLTAQTCSDGGYQWSDVATVFEDNGCNIASCHGSSALSGLNLTTYEGFNGDISKCSAELRTGTTLVDIIVTGNITCADGTVGNAMNNRIDAPVSQADLDALQAWVDSGSFEFCRGTPADDGYPDDCGSTIDALATPAEVNICTDGSNPTTLTLPTASLPDVQVVVEINGTLITVSDDGSFDTSTLMPGDEVCYTAFTYDLAAINALLVTANDLCPTLDILFPDLQPCGPIGELIAGTNPNGGDPGLDDLLEVLEFAASLSAPIISVQSATSVLEALNGTITPLNLGPICYATSNNVCLTAEECISFVELPTNDGYDDCNSSVDEIGNIGVTGACSDGSNLPSITPPASSALPDVQIAAEVNEELVGISPDGSFDTAGLGLVAGDEVCYSAFAFDLAAINTLLNTANDLCPTLDILFPDLLPCAPIGELIAGTNEGSQSPGLEDLQEVLNFASSLSTPISSVQTAISTLNTLNETITPLNLGPICYAVSSNTCVTLSDDACGPCSGEEAEVTFSVDMSCSGTTARPPVVTGPFNSFSGDGNIMEDPDGDDIWEAVICVVPGTAFEYKYAILDFAEQEDLIDDVQGGGSCAPITDFFSFANREITIPAGGGALPTDAYGICGTCANPPISVTFTVDMNCSGVAAGTDVAITGGFNGFCDGCSIMDDSDGDGVWERTYVFPRDETGCYKVNYLYQAPNWGNAEDFLGSISDFADCGIIDTDNDTYANRGFTICEDTVLEDYWFSCGAPSDPGCDDGNCSNGVETWDGCACIEGTPGETPTCDDGDCTNGLETYNETTCMCDPGTPPVDPGCDDGDCTNGVETWDGCECVAGEAPVDPGCDDGDCSNGVETWDGCECVAGEAPVDPGCDDGDCSNGVETWDGCECVAGVAGEIPMCDDGDCSNGVETYDAANCECVAGTAPVDPGCDDGDCTNGLETWDGCECVAGEAPVDPGCDDGNCSNGVESWDGCECIAGEAPVDPGCDDGDCSNGVETWNGCECVAGVAGEEPMCDDGDCSNGLETYDAANCECVAGTAPVDPGCDDGDCSNGVETWDGCECVAGVAGEIPMCDDGDCTNGVETYNEATCSCDPGTPPTCPEGETLNAETCVCESVLVCEDPCAPNFGESEACETYSTDCNTDCTMGDIEVWNSESCSCEIETIVVLGCTDSSASNYNPDANCNDGTCEDAPCVPPTPGEIDCE